MRCSGRTRSFKRCKNNCKIVFCSKHKLQWWAIVVILATLGGVFQDIIKPIFTISLNNELISNGASQNAISPFSPKIRFKYLLCTGPYNNIFRDSNLKSDYQINKGLFVVKNELTELLISLEKGYAGVGTYTYVPELVLDSLANVDRSLWGLFGKSKSSKEKIGKEHESALSKLIQYEEFLTSIDFTLRNCRNVFGREFLPESANYVLDHFPEFDMEVKAVLGIILVGVHGSSSVGLRLHHNSIRSLILEIENVSSEVIFDISVQLESFDTIKSLGNFEAFKFPLIYLAPKEKILVPLSLKSVPSIYAERYIYETEFDSLMDFRTHGLGTLFELDSFRFRQQFNPSNFKSVSKSDLIDVDNNNYYDNFDILKGNLTISDFPIFIELQDNLSNTPFSIGKRYELRSVTFKSESDPYTMIKEYRQLDSSNLVLVNDNCECGSCPIISYVNNYGKLCRIQEFLVECKSIENMDTFLVEIPNEANLVIIEENKGEVAYLSAMELIIIANGSAFVVGKIDSVNEVKYNAPLILDIEEIKKSSGILDSDIDQVYIRGVGYYDTENILVCDHLFPIKKELIDLE